MPRPVNAVTVAPGYVLLLKPVCHVGTLKIPLTPPPPAYDPPLVPHGTSLAIE